MIAGCLISIKSLFQTLKITIMKKIFTLILFAAGISLTASAQYGNDRYNNNQGRNDGYQSGDNRSYGDRQQSNNNYGYNDRGYNDRGYNNRGYNDRRYNDRRQREEEYRRQQEIDRMNQQCDQQIEVYRNDRSMNGYERNRRIQQVEYERQQKQKAFGKGLVVAGIAAIIIGSIFAHGN